MNVSAVSLRRLTILAMAVGLSANAGATDQSPSNDSIKIPAAKVQFGRSGVINHGQEILASNAYGNIVGGKHGSFLKFPAGFHSYVHTHTYDYFAVVLKGVITNPVKGETGEVKLVPGSYWYQKGGEAHSTNCISKQPCTVFIVQMDGKFDAQVLEKTEPGDAPASSGAGSAN
jgi:beta-alanine degradation protein BauB